MSKLVNLFVGGPRHGETIEADYGTAEIISLASLPIGSTAGFGLGAPRAVNIPYEEHKYRRMNVPQAQCEVWEHHTLWAKNPLRRAAEIERKIGALMRERDELLAKYGR